MSRIRSRVVLLVSYWCFFPKWVDASPSQETATGVADASEPLCIAQGAAANVSKISRRHLRTTIESHAPVSRPSRLILVCSCLAPGFDSKTHSTRIAHSPRCLQYDSPETTSPLAAHYTPAAHRGNTALRAPTTTLLTRRQMLKTRRKKNVKKGIQFCLMVCGASGTGTLRPGQP